MSAQRKLKRRQEKKQPAIENFQRTIHQIQLNAFRDGWDTLRLMLAQRGITVVPAHQFMIDNDVHYTLQGVRSKVHAQPSDPV